MRKGILSVAIAIIFCAVGYCGSLSNCEGYNLSDIDTVASTYIPKDLLGIFNELTVMEDDESTAELRIRVLAVGVVETGWKNVVSKPNKNGSYDIGYLQLNSYNLKNKEFMELFGPTYIESNISDVTRTSFVTCVKYYKYLYKIYGEDSYFCYNAGERRFLKGNLPKSTKSYAKKVKVALRNIVDEVELATADRIVKEAERARFYEWLHSIQTTMWEPEEEEDEPVPSFMVSTQLTFRKPQIDLIVVCKRLVCGLNSDYEYVGIRKLKDGDTMVSVFRHLPTQKLVGFKLNTASVNRIIRA